LQCGHIERPLATERLFSIRQTQAFMKLPKIIPSIKNINAIIILILTTIISELDVVEAVKSSAIIIRTAYKAGL
jgi:hypothetical protein